MLYNTRLEIPACGNYVRARRKKEPISCLNILVVGRTGTGKTAFVRALCRRLQDITVQGTLKTSKPFVLDGPLQPTEETYHVSMHVKNGKREGTTALTIIDTPGFVHHGTTMDRQLLYFSKYIDHQYAKTLNEESKLRRDKRALLDTHVHACIYVLDTTAGTTTISNVIDETDCHILRALSSRVNVIPIIGKAITPAQRERLKRSCRREIFDTLQIPVYGYQQIDPDDTIHNEPTTTTTTTNSTTNKTTLDNILKTLQEYVDNEDDDDKEDALKMIEYLETMPYIVCGYHEEREMQTGRPYSVFRQNLKNDHDDILVTLHGDPKSNSDDLHRLEKMLIKDHRDMLRIDTFEQFYEHYRTEQLLSHRANKLAAEPPNMAARIS